MLAEIHAWCGGCGLCGLCGGGDGCAACAVGVADAVGAAAAAGAAGGGGRAAGAAIDCQLEDAGRHGEWGSRTGRAGGLQGPKRLSAARSGVDGVLDLRSHREASCRVFPDHLIILITAHRRLSFKAPTS